MWVVFEGQDGSGKSTMIKKVAQELEGRGYKVVCVREPDGDIRKKVCNTAERLSWKDEYQLMEECHKEIMQTKVNPALKEGYIVLSDRSFIYSSMVYQARDDKEAHEMRMRYIKTLKLPDIAFIMNTSPKLCRDRARGTRDEEASVFDTASKKTYKRRHKKYMGMLCYPETVEVTWSSSINLICDMIIKRGK